MQVCYAFDAPWIQKLIFEKVYIHTTLMHDFDKHFPDKDFNPTS